MHTRWARLARGWVAAGFATFVAAFSHTLAGGSPPTLFALGVSVVIAGRQLSLWRLAVSVAVSQALFHGVFSSLGTPVLVEHSHAQQLAMSTQHGHATMWGAHVIAGVITIIALRFGEQAFWGFARTAWLLLVRLLRWVVATPIPPAPSIPPLIEDFISRTTLLLSVMRHRGPPRGFAAV